jgi:transcriptional regulator with PAS, ATPase and Fis domain
MKVPDWVDGFQGAVTIANREGTIVYMNETAQKSFEKSGGAALIGKNLADCHKPSSTAKIAAIVETGKPNTYTIEKGGIHKVIHQSPWREGGETKGIVEISFEIPQKLPHFVRD